MPALLSLEDPCECLTEVRLRELFGLPAHTFGVESVSHALEAVDGCAQRLHALLAEKHAGLTVYYGLRHSATAVRDYGRSTCLGLDRGDAEIFLGSENERSGVLEVVTHDVEGLLPQNGHVRAGIRLNSLHLRPITDDDELLVGHRAERARDQVDSLVGDEA
jgi:hypothetical protein